MPEDLGLAGETFAVPADYRRRGDEWMKVRVERDRRVQAWIEDQKRVLPGGRVSGR